jgi:hypothetical protein
VGIFQSKAEKDLVLAINFLNEFLSDFMSQWDKKLKFMISSKAASEQPLEKVEPFMRRVWIETYKSGIELMIESEKRYELVSIRTPSIRNYINHEEFKSVYSNFVRELGQSVGVIVKEICDINNDWSPSLFCHLEDPLLNEFKSIAKEELKEYLHSNGKYYS